MEFNKRKGKVDHRPTGSKDVSDSLAGVVYDLEVLKFPEPMAPSLGIVGSHRDDEEARKRAEIDWLLGRRSSPTLDEGKEGGNK